MVSSVTASSASEDRFIGILSLDSFCFLKLADAPCLVVLGVALPLMRREIIPDQLAILHHEANALEFMNVRNGISQNSDEIGEFPRLDGAHPVLPAQHFRSVGRNGANHVKWLHPGIVQSGKPRHRGLPTSFSRIEPAHVRPSRELHSGLQNPLDQTVVSLVLTFVGLIGTFRSRLQTLSQIVVPLPGTLIGIETFRSQL